MATIRPLLQAPTSLRSFATGVSGLPPSTDPNSRSRLSMPAEQADRRNGLRMDERLRLCHTEVITASSDSIQVQINPSVSSRRPHRATHFLSGRLTARRSLFYASPARAELRVRHSRGSIQPGKSL